MRYDYSMRLRDDVNSAVEKAFKTAGIVNITSESSNCNNDKVSDVTNCACEIAGRYSA